MQLNLSLRGTKQSASLDHGNRPRQRSLICHCDERSNLALSIMKPAAHQHLRFCHCEERSNLPHSITKTAAQQHTCSVIARNEAICLIQSWKPPPRNTPGLSLRGTKQSTSLDHGNRHKPKLCSVSVVP